MIKTPEGKYVVFDENGQQIERWPIDAKLLVQNGSHSFEAPEGVEPKLPLAPPRHVGAPRAKAVKTFEQPEASNA
jgi:hypothetical protein